MQSTPSPALAGRVAAILADPGCGDKKRNLIELPEPPFDSKLLETYEGLNRRRVGYRGMRNPRAFREAFRAMDDSNDGIIEKTCR